MASDRESPFAFLRRGLAEWRFRRKYGYTPRPIPAEDVERARLLAIERNWKDVGK